MVEEEEEEEKLTTPPLSKAAEITELTMTALRWNSMQTVVAVGAVCMGAKRKRCLSPSTVSFIFSRIASRSSTPVAPTLSKGSFFFYCVRMCYYNI